MENQSREIDGIVAAFQELPYDIDIRVSRENWDGTSSASITSSWENHISPVRKMFPRKSAADGYKELRQPYANVSISQTEISFGRMILKSWIMHAVGFCFLVYLAWMIGLFLVGKAIPVNEYELRHSESWQPVNMTNDVTKAESLEVIKIKAVCNGFN